MKILIELPTWLGDTVMATPAIESLVNHFSDIEITLLGSFVSIENLMYFSLLEVRFVQNLLNFAFHLKVSINLIKTNITKTIK